MELSSATLPPTETGVTASPAYIDAVLDAWHADTAGLGSVAAMMAHPAHAHLASLGQPVARRLLDRMAGEPESSHPGWFALLEEITGTMPVPAEHADDLVKMAEHWIEWGKFHANWLYLPFG